MKKILFLSNHFLTLYSFRRELIQMLVKDGYSVFLSMPESTDNTYFSDLGCKIIDTPIDRRGMNPLADIKLMRKYLKIMRQIQPDIVFSYTIKPNIFGTIASNILHIKQICNITGTGATFLRNSLLSTIVGVLYRFSIRKCYKVFFQNTADRDLFVKRGFVANNWGLLPGSGVNLELFQFTDTPNDATINFIYIGRIMKVKGIDQYFECAEKIRTKYPNSRFYIAGFIEEESYRDVIEYYNLRGIINYLGYQKDIVEWIKKCNCTVLPSHGGEGVPNVLLESAAIGRGCIGSKINGTKDVINDGVTGYLFDTGDSSDLADKIEKFILLTPQQRTTMGKAGREKVELEFDRKWVIQKYVDEIEKA